MGSHRAWESLGPGGGACLRTWVLLGELAIDIEHSLTECGEVIEGIGDASINRNMSMDTRSEPSFEVEVGPVHVDDVFANLGNDSLEFSVVFKDRT